MKPRPFPRPRPPPWYLSPPRLLSAQIFPGESSVQSGLSEPPALGPCRVLPVWNPIQKTEDRTLGKSVSFVCLLLHLSRDRGPPPHPTHPRPATHTHTQHTTLHLWGHKKKEEALGAAGSSIMSSPKESEVLSGFSPEGSPSPDSPNYMLLSNHPQISAEVSPSPTGNTY